MAAVRSEEQFLCSICLDLFTEPVSTPCGHNFCRPCLSQHWDTHGPCRCPLCKEMFQIKPELRVNTLVSELVSQFKQETERRPEVSTPGQVSCDHCSVPKLKAVKSCLVCLSSYCERHLLPHLSLSGLKSHQLMKPVEHMEDRLCPQHHKPLELFCSNDHSLLCTMCVLEHQSHKFVSLKEAFDQRKVSLLQMQQQSRSMVHKKRLNIQEIQSSVQLSQKAADREKNTGLQIFNSLIESVQRSKENFLQDLQDKQRMMQTQADDLIQQLKQDSCELEKRSTEAEELLRSEDHLLFLKHYPAMSSLKDSRRLRLEPQTFEGTAARALCELTQSLNEIFTEQMEKVTKPEVIKEHELKRVRQFAVDLTLDPDTANVNLSVSKDLKQVHHTDQMHFSDSHLRFSWRNILTKQSFSSGRFYFEVQVKDKTIWTLGVASELVDRTNTCGLNISYGYLCLHMEYGNRYFASTDPRTPLSLKCAPQKLGVFVDYEQGLVSFYDADSADLIYSFTGCCFQNKLFPFLNPCVNAEGKNSAPLILTPVKK